MPLAKGFLEGAACQGGRVANVGIVSGNSKTKFVKNAKLNKFAWRRQLIANIRNGGDDTKVSDLVIIKCHAGTNRKPLRVLIDSGAQANVMSLKAVKNLQLELRASDIKLVSAQKEKLDVEGETEMDLIIANNQYNVKVVATPVLMEGIDIILGMSFLNEHETQLLTTPGQSPKFCIDSQCIPMVKENKCHGVSIYTIKTIRDEDITELVRSSKAVTLPPRSAGQLKLKVPYNEILLRNKVLFHPSDVEDSLTKEEWDDFEIPESLVKVRVTPNKKMFAWVKYRNHGYFPKVLKQGQLLGGLSIDNEIYKDDEEVNLINSVNLTKPGIPDGSRWSKIRGLLEGKTPQGSPEEAALLRVMQKHTNVVQLEGEKFKTTDTVEHFIDYQGPPDLFTPAYKTARFDQEEIDKEIERLEREEHIEPSTSGFNSPLIPVRKKNGNLRICEDFRNLNRYTRKQRFPLPDVTEILNSLHEAKYFCVIDLKSAFMQIRLAKCSRPLTAFRTPKGCWQFVHMPFGLCNSPSSLQRLMLQCTNGLTNVHVFLDDILVYGSSLKECEMHLDRVLSRLSDHNLTIQLPKCEFFKNQCNYLGHVISDKGLSPDPDKVKAIKEYPIPHDLQAVRSFMGLASYYRKFIPKFSHIASPLHDLTRGYPGKGKNVKIQWTNKEDQAFNQLKEAILDNALLKYPDYSRGFRLTVDASATAIGGCLSQLDDDDRDRPVSFFSKKLLPAERKYDAINREALAIIYGLKVNRPTILGREVSILSDNAPLTWMLKTPTPSSRVSRWQILLSEYNITNISHVSGRQNVVADALSRCDTVDTLLQDIPALNAVQLADDDSETIDWNVEEIGSKQLEFPLFREIIHFISGKKAQLPRYLAAPINQFELESGILYFKTINDYKNAKYRVCVPPSYYKKALKLAHSVPFSGHCGISTTIERLKSFAFWPTMSRDVKNFVNSCTSCLRTKNSKGHKAPILRNPEVSGTMQRLNMDLIGPLPESQDNHRYILTLVDVLSRYGFAVPLKDKSASTVSRALINQVIGPFGPPRSIYSDSGREFTAEITAQVLKAMGVHQRHITVYRPQASGMVERLNSTLTSILRALVHEHPGSWDASLPLALLAYNTAYHRTLKESPFFIFFLRDPNLPYSTLLGSQSPWYCVDSVKHEMLLRSNTAFLLARKYIEEGKQEQEKYGNRKAKLRPIKEGDRVWLKKVVNVSKLGAKYAGPMRVVKTLGVIYWVRDLTSLKIYQVHVDRLKHEQEVSKDEAASVRDAFPVGDTDLGNECDKVSKQELESEGIIEPKKGETTLGEDFCNEQIGVSETVLNSGKEHPTNELTDQAEVSPVSDKPSPTYSLRNRGAITTDQPWVMERPVEFKVRK